MSALSGTKTVGLLPVWPGGATSIHLALQYDGDEGGGATLLTLPAWLRPGTYYVYASCYRNGVDEDPKYLLSVGITVTGSGPNLPPPGSIDTTIGDVITTDICNAVEKLAKDVNVCAVGNIAIAAHKVDSACNAFGRNSSQCSLATREFEEVVLNELSQGVLGTQKTFDDALCFKYPTLCMAGGGSNFGGNGSGNGGLGGGGGTF